MQWFDYESKNIQPADEEACFCIYHDNNLSSRGDPDVGHLLAVLGYMPFADTLMAKLGMEGMSTAKELLDAWRKSGPDIILSLLPAGTTHADATLVSSGFGITDIDDPLLDRHFIEDALLVEHKGNFSIHLSTSCSPSCSQLKPNTMSILSFEIERFHLIRFSTVEGFECIIFEFDRGAHALNEDPSSIWQVSVEEVVISSSTFSTALQLWNGTFLQVCA